MLNTRYWWLEGAPTDAIRRGIGNVFDTYDIECIAPGYGCILAGRNVVARHYKMLDDFLKACCDKSVAVSRYVTRRGALIMLDKVSVNKMPREIAPGVF